MPDTIWPPIERPGDLASYMLRHMTYHGTATVPQRLIDRFGGFQNGLGTHMGSSYRWSFKLVGQYSEGPPGYNQCGTVIVDSFGLRLTDEHDRKLWWVDFQSDGDMNHREMHYHEAGWEGGMRVYSSRDKASFWSNISKWQSPAFTEFLQEYQGQESKLFDIE